MWHLYYFTSIGCLIKAECSETIFRYKSTYIGKRSSVEKISINLLYVFLFNHLISTTTTELHILDIKYIYSWAPYYIWSSMTVTDFLYVVLSLSLFFLLISHFYLKKGPVFNILNVINFYFRHVCFYVTYLIKPYIKK